MTPNLNLKVANITIRKSRFKGEQSALKHSGAAGLLSFMESAQGVQVVKWQGKRELGSPWRRPERRQRTVTQLALAQLQSQASTGGTNGHRSR